MFPNFSQGIHVWHPRGPLRTEVWMYRLIPKNLSDEEKHQQARLANQAMFSPAGMYEQDDIENWEQSTLACMGAVGRRYPLNYQMGIGHEDLIEDGENPPHVTALSSEYPQRGFYKRWAEMMSGHAWDEV